VDTDLSGDRRKFIKRGSWLRKLWYLLVIAGAAVHLHIVWPGGSIDADMKIPADGDRADQPVPFSAAPASAAAAPSPLILSCPRMLALRFSDAPAHAFQPASLPPHMTMILGPVSIFHLTLLFALIFRTLCF
jgi:hypothetical protein